MNTNDDFADEEISLEELNRVSSALDALEQHRNNPTNKAWEAIMEDYNQSNSRTKRISNIVSLAAASVLIVAIAGAAFVISVKNNSDVKSINRKPKPVETSSTKPHITEERLLAGSIVIDKFSISDSNGKLLGKIDTQGLNSLRYEAISGGHLILSGLPSSSAESNLYLPDQPKSQIISNYIDVDLKTMKSQRVNSARIWSPDGKQYFECGVCGDSNSVAVVVDASTGKKRTFKGETGAVRPNSNDTESSAPYAEILDARWVDNNRLIIMRSLGEMVNGEARPTQSADYALVDLRNKISILNAPAIKMDVTCCDADGAARVHDVIIENGRILLLVSHEVMFYQDNLSKFDLRVIDAVTGENVWVKEYPVNPDMNRFVALTFGKTSNEVYGQELEAGAEVGFGYDHASDITINRGQLMTSKSKL